LDQLVGRHLAMSLAGQTLLKADAMTQASTELLAQFLGPRTVAGLTFAAAFLYIIAFRPFRSPSRFPARPSLILARYSSGIFCTTKQ
jgi:hypothetical protein